MEFVPGWVGQNGDGGFGPGPRHIVTAGAWWSWLYTQAWFLLCHAGVAPRAALRVIYDAVIQAGGVRHDVGRNGLGMLTQCPCLDRG